MSIGIFDSGVGGLSVLRVLQVQFPNTKLIYFADQAYIPYGTRPTEEIQIRSEQITRFLIEQGCELIVIACNTATAAAINLLRQKFPQTPFVGMEPAIKPAVSQTRTRAIGVLATANTFKSQRYASLLARFASEVTLLQDPCLGLVELIEAGDVTSKEIGDLLVTAVAPMQEQGVDVIILGCTHYPFVQAQLRRIVGDEIALIDPAEAIARQVGRLVGNDGLDVNENGDVPTDFWTTGKTALFAQQAKHLLGLDASTNIKKASI